jgi:hypothetical protein
MKMKYFSTSYIVTVLGLIGGLVVGYIYSGNWQGALSTMFLTAILAVLEVSLSFDNAVVNASVLKRMTPVWRHRFITWGILIAVFGMRLIFPLAIVSIIADVTPWAALQMAAMRPQEYADTMMKSHLVLAGFGGAFLLMVAFKYFFDANKDIHWVHAIESPLARLGKIEAIGLAISLLILYGLSKQVGLEGGYEFLLAGIFGLITFVAVDGISALLEEPESGVKDMAKASVGLFLYLEVLDASFSFDGVIGAFALTHNLFVIAIGLGIGAMFVRSLTIMLVDEGTLQQFRFLEHGAFYAIGALAAMMLLEAITHIPEVVTGLIGAAILGLSFWSSVRYNRKCGPTQSHL